MSAGCDFHARPQGDCVHCLGWELALARAEIARLTEWVRHLTHDPTCDEAMAGFDRVPLGCVLPVGHPGRHRTSVGTEWHRLASATESASNQTVATPHADSEASGS